MKVSKVADSLMSYTEQFMEYDPFVSAVEPSNPWISDDATFWDLETRWGLKQVTWEAGTNHALKAAPRAAGGVQVSVLMNYCNPELGGICLFADEH